MAAKQEKMIEEIGNMSVIDLSNLVKALEEAFGISAAMPVAAAAAPVAAAAAAEEKSEYQVTLVSVSDKIKAIKALRAVIPGLSLTDAKQKVEEAPTVIVEAAPKEEAQKIQKELEAAGATVKLA